MRKLVKTRLTVLGREDISNLCAEIKIGGKNLEDILSGGGVIYHAAGNATIATLPTPGKDYEGFTYNMSEDFTITSDFVEYDENTPKSYPAGTNVAVVNAGTVNEPVYKYDVLGGAGDNKDYEAIKEAFDFTTQPSKNLYDYATVGVVEGLINTTGEIFTPPTLVGYATGLIPVQPNHYYYLSNRANNVAKSVKCLASDGTSKMKVRAASNDAEYSTYAFPNIDATDVAANGQFKTPADAAYIQINLTPTDTETLGDYYKIMLEDVGDAYDPNFVPSAYEPYESEQTATLKDENLQFPVAPLREQVEGLRSIKVLCVGSSITQDEMSYLPTVLKSIAPSVQLTIGLAYIGGAPLAQHTAYLTDETIEYEGYRYYIDNGVYKKMQLSNDEVTTYSGYALYKSVNGGAWQNAGSKTIEQVIANEQWDIITYQGSAKEADENWDEAYAPFVYKIENAVYANLTHNAKLGWILIHSGYCNNDAAYIEKWLGIAQNTKKLMKQTGVSILFPSGTAVQNLRTIQALRELGDGAHANLLADNAHLQEGIGCLCAAYANAITILNAMGLDYESVIGDQTRPDAAWVTEQNIPGANLGPDETGSGVIGITDANCLLAQIAAVSAVKYPYSVINPSVSSPYGDRVVAEVGDETDEVINAVISEALNSHEAALRVLAGILIGEIRIPALSVERIDQTEDSYYNGMPRLLIGAGAPGVSVRPDNFPDTMAWTGVPMCPCQEYYDKTNAKYYKAKPTLSGAVSDWIALN